MKCNDSQDCPCFKILGAGFRKDDCFRKKTCHLTDSDQRIIEAMLKGEIPEDALAIMRHALNSTDFAIDDAEERENGDKFITVWYREQPRDKCLRCGGCGIVAIDGNLGPVEMNCPTCHGSGVAP